MRSASIPAMALKTAIATCGLWLAAGEALAQDSIWTHNGSQMLWHAEGDLRIISYLVPRPGLPVAPGTVLFEGRRFGDVLEGTARIFREGCPPAEYSVAGEIASETHVVLFGPAPVRAPSGCTIASYSDETSNAVLEFTYLSSGSQPVTGNIDVGGSGVEEQEAYDAERAEELGQDQPGYQSMVLLVSGGHQITVHVETGVGSHVMPDMVNAVLTCRSGESHVLMPERLNVCYLENAATDPAAGALVLSFSRYNHDTAVCDDEQAAYSYAGLCE
jgi:hypothetical protein